jgi:hypothetical protein
MHSGKYVFAQVLDFINRYEFEKCVTQGAFFVIRAKEGLNFNVATALPVNRRTGLICDQIIGLNVWKSKKLYPEKLRRVEYYDKEKKNTLVFLTNNMTARAAEIVQLYIKPLEDRSVFKLIK